MRIHTDSALGKNESIEVTKRFRICGHTARTIYGDTKEELIKKVTSREIIGDYHSLQEYKNDRWTTIGKFRTR